MSNLKTTKDVEIFINGKNIGKADLILFPSEPEIKIEAKCKVCNDWVSVGYFHSTCYRQVDGSLMLADSSNEIIID